MFTQNRRNRSNKYIVNNTTNKMVIVLFFRTLNKPNQRKIF